MIVFRDATVYDGSGNPEFFADVAIERDRIAAVGDTGGAPAESIDARGLCLAPGFIDVHTHDDFAAIRHRDMAFKLRGGVTSCIVGNCGFGPAPFDAATRMLEALSPGAPLPAYDGHRGYADLLASRPPGVNIGLLAGHGTLRLATMGNADRAPDDVEMRAMKSLLNEALDAGAFGLSSGLIYEPGRYARTEELVELCAPMRGTGALYATHMRDEADGLLDSVDEAITIGRSAGIPVQISHLKASGRDNWGRVRAALRKIEDAQSRGESVHADQYPYTAGSTGLAAVLANGAFTQDPGGIGRIEARDVVIASCPDAPEWEGRTVEDIAASMSLAPRDAAMRLLDVSPATTCIIHMMDETDVRTVMQHQAVMIGSDGLPTLDGKPHPRLYNTFARVLGHYSRDLGLLDLADAIHRMTGFSADKFGIVGRGRIEPGAYADVVVFDRDAIIDRGTYARPNAYPDGIRHVLVNGEFAVRDGDVAGICAGRVLRRTI